MTARRRTDLATQPARRPAAAACEVWWATPSTNPGLAELLDDAELRRAGRLRHPGDRGRFVTARALLRLVLAERSGTAPSALHLDTTCHRCGADHGKPRLIGGGTVTFSIAHSADRVAVAVADGVSVGVDVESVASRDAADLAALVAGILTSAELADYRELAPSQRARALAVWWTRKEAVLKATGAGLMIPMSDLAVTTPDQPAALRKARGTLRRSAAMVTLADLNPGDGAVGCVAALQVSSLAVAERDGDELLARVAPPPVATTLS